MPHRQFPRWMTCVLLMLACDSALAQSPATSKTPVAPPPGEAAIGLEVFPAVVELDGPRATQHLGVLGTYKGGRTWDVTLGATYTSANPDVAAVSPHGFIQPVKDGETTIDVTVGTVKKSIPVKVKRVQADVPVAFTREIVPVLTKAGCNGGACHGSQHGKGGFKLSLFGFDPIFDYAQIVQSAEGRRALLGQPENSILLLKPTLQMEHGGGERFKIGSRDYVQLKRWLQDGAPEPSAKDVECQSLEVWPRHRIMVPGETQHIRVTATWSDGLREDVTPIVQFNSLNDAVASVTPEGLVTCAAKGETHIMLRFAGQATVVQISSPYARIEPYPDVARNNFIDDKLVAKWKDLGLTPSPLCSDDDFLRRIYLDAIGTLPTPEEIKAFQGDKASDKRAKWIDKVLDRPEFVDFWAYKWGDLLRVNRDFLQDRGMWSFHNWVRACLRDKKPVDEMVRDIITAEGSTFTEGPANYYMVARTPGDWAETTSQLFLGVRIGCAKCHHHPFEKWSQDDYYGMAAFFVRLGTKNSQEFGMFGREQVVYLKDKGEQTHPRKGGVVPPHPLDGPTMTDPLDRRVKLAEWLTSPKNPFFAHNLANRFWGYLMGRGLIEPLDDLRATNPASNPELLDALAQEFVKSKFDLRHLLKTIMNSRAYQLSAEVNPGNKADAANVFHARFTVRRLAAEQLADAVDFATGTREKYPGLPLGTRAIQLPDTSVKSYLLDVFGRPARQITCECERTTQPNIAQAMHLIHGDFLNKKIGDANGRVEKLFKEKKALPVMIEEMYLVTLSRPPRPAEMTRAIGWVQRAPTEKEGVQDLLWTLLNSREFLFVH